VLPIIDYYVGYPALKISVPAFSSGSCKVLSKLEFTNDSKYWKESRFTWIKEDQKTTAVAPYTTIFTQTPLQYVVKTKSKDDIGKYTLRATLWSVGVTDDFADAGETLTGKDVPTLKVRIMLSPKD